ncbi:hypothetical protein [Kitasatospora sp. NPDC059571]|uniref:hypothetical protein n=1 Tax=Kitasatospora sp. NPDC059571 TaxID=3346871 RepID=UPI0036B7BB79
MSTLAKATRRTRKKPTAPDPGSLTEAALRHYTAEEIEELRLLPCKASWLKRKAYAREIPFNGTAGKLTWRLDQILEISREFDSIPVGVGRAA